LNKEFFGFRPVLTASLCSIYIIVFGAFCRKTNTAFSLWGKAVSLWDQMNTIL